MSLNNKPVPQIDDSHEYLRKDGYITLPEDLLLLGKDQPNTIILDFQNTYYNDGFGIHSYKDIDGKQYVYTIEETHFINRLFPVFDQPDLKAPMALEVKVPSDWVVISNQIASSISEPLDGEMTWKYPKTLPLSSYLYTVIAGPYKRIDCPDDKLYRNIPMAIYCRETLYKYALKQQVFILTFFFTVLYQFFFRID